MGGKGGDVIEKTGRWYLNWKIIQKKGSHGKIEMKKFEETQRSSRKKRERGKKRDREKE